MLEPRARSDFRTDHAKQKASHLSSNAPFRDPDPLTISQARWTCWFVWHAQMSTVTPSSSRAWRKSRFRLSLIRRATLRLWLPPLLLSPPRLMPARLNIRCCKRDCSWLSFWVVSLSIWKWERKMRRDIRQKAWRDYIEYMGNAWFTILFLTFLVMFTRCQTSPQTLWHAHRLIDPARWRQRARWKTPRGSLALFHLYQ